MKVLAWVMIVVLRLVVHAHQIFYVIVCKFTLLVKFICLLVINFNNLILFLSLLWRRTCVGFPSSSPSVSAKPSSQPSESTVPSVQPSVSMIPSLAPSISSQPSSSSQPSTCVVEITSPVETLIGNSGAGRQLNFAFANLKAAFGDDVLVEVNTRGDTNGSTEFYTITTEGGLVSLGNTSSDPVQCNVAYSVDTFTIAQADFNGYIAGDGTLTIEADPSSDVNLCPFNPGESEFNDVFVKLSYIACGLE